MLYEGTLWISSETGRDLGWRDDLFNRKDSECQLEI